MSFSGLHVFIIGLLICFVRVQAEAISLSPDNVLWQTVPRTEAEACFAYNSTMVEGDSFCVAIITESKAMCLYHCSESQCQSISLHAQEPAASLFSAGSENRLSGASTAALLFSALLSSPDKLIEKGIMVLGITGVIALIVAVGALLLEPLLVPYVLAAGAYLYSGHGLIIVTGTALTFTALMTLFYACRH